MTKNQLKCSAAETEDVIAQLFVGWAAQHLGQGQARKICGVELPSRPRFFLGQPALPGCEAVTLSCR